MNPYLQYLLHLAQLGQFNPQGQIQLAEGGTGLTPEDLNQRYQTQQQTYQGYRASAMNEPNVDASGRQYITSPDVPDPSAPDTTTAPEALPGQELGTPSPSPTPFQPGNIPPNPFATPSPVPGGPGGPPSATIQDTGPYTFDPNAYGTLSTGTGTPWTDPGSIPTATGDATIGSGPATDPSGAGLADPTLGGGVYDPYAGPSDVLGGTGPAQTPGEITDNPFVVSDPSAVSSPGEVTDNPFATPQVPDATGTATIGSGPAGPSDTSVTDTSNIPTAGTSPDPYGGSPQATPSPASFYPDGLGGYTPLDAFGNPVGTPTPGSNPFIGGAFATPAGGSIGGPLGGPTTGTTSIGSNYDYFGRMGMQALLQGRNPGLGFQGAGNFGQSTFQGRPLANMLAPSQWGGTGYGGASGNAYGTGSVNPDAPPRSAR